ncbi:DUF4296 domain-containing protein [Altibacter sp.]|uniref:DUF4296 domain-containing protein n=1 Tax=Altibacter sp. TaxID=2024823 RepID=UPI0025890A1C|nr:DUF4296 domain-containing protein [Altibacter sp.]MCW9038805.1 DUF4296 domain-containing protein [Altibacter sp.]
MALLVLLMSLACQDVKRPERPDDLISEEKMVDIFVDAYLMNAARSISVQTINESGIKLDSILYKKYAIDSLQFVKSNAYYTANLNGYIDLFTKVESRLQDIKEEKDSLQKVFQKEEGFQQKIDSVKQEQTLVQPVASDSLPPEE